MGGGMGNNCGAGNFDLALLQGFSPAETGWVTGYQRRAAGYVQFGGGN
jgi:hypothetical protein